MAPRPLARAWRPEPHGRTGTSTPPMATTSEHTGVPEATHEQLDHALIALAHPLGHAPVVPEGPPRGWIELPATAATLALGMPIAILHHPRSAPIKLTLDTHAL